MSEILQLTKENALKAYNEGSDSHKELLIKLYGKKVFRSESVIERVKTLEDACEELGVSFNNLFDNCKDASEEARVAIELFAEALREGKAPKDSVWYPYFYKDSGGGFSFDDTLIASRYGYVGARLRVDSSEKAQHLGDCMTPYYKTYLLGE